MHVTTTDFKNRYGMPATEFSVYILNEDTIEESGDVVNNGDGTYSQTFRLSTDGEKAVYYYRQQMRETRIGRMAGIRINHGNVYLRFHLADPSIAHAGIV